MESTATTPGQASERSLDINFFDDWASLVRRELTKLGYSVDPATSAMDAALALANVRLRQPAAKPRTVVKSREFSCPAAHQAALVGLEAKMSAGDDLTPHLSRRLLQLDYDDPMLNDWGIHHFHLTDSLESDGFVTRSGPLLFAYLTDTKAYFLDVMAHGDWEKRFSCTFRGAPWV